MELRPTGIEVIGDARWGTHFCQFYGNREDLTDILVPYFRAGLEHNELCMWVTSPPLDVREAWDALAGAVPDLESYRKRGRIEILPYTDWYVLGGSFDQDRVLKGWVEKLEAALARGCAGLRLTGNTFWLEKSDWRGFTEYEAAVDSVIGRYRMLALCTYSLDRCGAAEIADVIRNHQFALLKRDGAWERLESYERRRHSADIIERAQAEEALADTRKKYQDLVEANVDLIWEVDSQWRYTYCSPQMEKLWGFKPEAMIGKTPFDVMPPGERERGLEVFVGMAQRRVPFSRIEVPSLNSRGESITVEISGVPFFDEGGALLGFRGMTRDITERKAVENALRESRENLDRAQEVGQIGWWRLDTQRDVLTWSDENHRIFGVPKGTPQSYESFLALVHPDDQEYVDARWTAALRGETYDIEHRIVTGGTVKWVREKAYLEFDAAGTLLGGFGITQDITERKRVEDQVHYQASLIDNVGDAVVSTDEGFRIKTWNRAAEITYGYTAPEALGRRVDDLLRTNFLGLQADEVVRQLQDEGVLRIEVVHHDKQGAPVEVQASVVALRDSGGRMRGTLGILRDITERRRSERQREHYLAQIEEANEAKDLFFNTLSHELRTPLAAMQNAIEILKNPDTAKGHRTRSLGILERNVRHQTRLIEDLLDLSRIMRGKVEIERDLLDLREVVNAQVEAVEGAVRKGQLTMGVEAPSEPVAVVGDAVRLGQVVSNLLTNAVKFTGAGGRIEIGVGRKDSEATVTVTDTGAGIAPDALSLIFEPFRQAETSLARSKGGLGIGLAVARSLAELHGGTLEAHSDGLYQGSEFTLRLPLHAGPQPAQVPPARDREAADQSKRVLIIEDNPDLRESLVILLEMMGHHVVAAPDGVTGVDLARRHRPEVMLVDIGLPDMDGYQVARILRSDPCMNDTRLIALTGYATPEHRECALMAGFNHHLAKPVAVEDLAQVLRGEKNGVPDSSL